MLQCLYRKHCHVHVFTESIIVVKKQTEMHLAQTEFWKKKQKIYFIQLHEVRY